MERKLTLDKCASLEEVRAHIDRLDHDFVALLAERGSYVKQAARFKKNSDEVRAPHRVEQVIARVTSLATELGANPVVVDAVYRAMIAAFIEVEMAAALGSDTSRDRKGGEADLVPR